MITMLMAEWILIGVGVAVVAVSILAAVMSSTVYDRLHFLTVLTTGATPLIGLAIAIDDGWSAADGVVLTIVVIVAVTGPVVGAATARTTAQREHLIDEEEPP